MSAFDDLTGQRFNHLTVINYVGRKNNNSIWKCQCDCGNIVEVRLSNLKSGKTKACGCLMKNGWGNGKTHGLSKSRPFKIWQEMKSRCNNPNYTYYKNYGARGIKVCFEWKDFVNFYDWAMSNGYADDLTLDRIDNNGNYEPSNCRWVNRKCQANNTRRNHFLEYQGQIKTIANWSDTFNVPYSNIYTYLQRHNWNIEQYVKHLESGNLRIKRG